MKRASVVMAWLMAVLVMGDGLPRYKEC
ncbi:hypothetical protein FDH07_gp53 [Propionibacterium phage Anatole]|uniref:Uncharacterized protein n=3 Tax=Anatolevirus TaxID=2169651 RepID=A0A1D8ETB7_9CAUD|nr:hypothetical protein FDH07_gp53 [Propionibacterium phage Anatole]YP_009596919.1 hypothetical protein FDH09_gp55 [Propionibacterium phage B3]AOT24291.1 hypothetical protein ANATOLE_53 [Propionibacterium phage Anatole]AOT24348.1 hypothetical protein B3_55 [Propionibacterium phage B3]AOT24527.1 hypothetical protein E1_53 [Propionibacterium phage E1]